jgi:23S rRNA-/tRNA-specific pseudouridylate synthase
VQFSATAEHAGNAWTRSLHERFPEFSRARLQDWIKRGRVLVNGAPRAPPACCARATAST